MVDEGISLAAIHRIDRRSERADDGRTAHRRLACGHRLGRIDHDDGREDRPLLLLKMSPLPLIVALAVVPLEVEGPALKKPPAIELAITMALPLSTLPPLRLGKVVPTTEMVPKLAKAPVEAAAVASLAQV